MLWSVERMTEHYRLALLRVVVGLFVMAGMAPDGTGVETLPRAVRLAILLVLRPAEAATRRIIFMRSRGIEVPEDGEPAARERSGRKTSGNKASGNKRGKRPPQFQLIDPRKFLEELYPNRRPPKAKPKRERSTEPQIQVRVAGFDGQPDLVIWSEPKAPILPDDEINAGPLCRRLLALKNALEDVPGQAVRMAREIAKRAKAPAGPGRVPPLRGGLPPGYRKRQIHEVDEILWDCHILALLDPKPDTS